MARQTRNVNTVGVLPSARYFTHVGVVALATCLTERLSVAQGVDEDVGYRPPNADEQDFEPMDALKGKGYGKQRFR